MIHFFLVNFYFIIQQKNILTWTSSSFWKWHQSSQKYTNIIHRFCRIDSNHELCFFKTFKICSYLKHNIFTLTQKCTIVLTTRSLLSSVIEPSQTKTVGKLISIHIINNVRIMKDCMKRSTPSYGIVIIISSNLNLN